MDNAIHKDIFSTLFSAHDILSADEINTIKENSHLKTFCKKDSLFEESAPAENLVFLKSGLVKLSKDLKHNRSLILKISTPGEFIGIMSQFGKKTYEYSATAIVDSEAYYIDSNVFSSILENNGKYAVYLMNIICAESLYIFNRIILQNHKQLPGKLADIILYFSETIYNSNSFVLPLTRTELAELAGTTKESFIRTLTEFKNDKIIQIDNKSITIVSNEILKTLSRIG
jgi:CRP-like cAMP-binding protein